MPIKGPWYITRNAVRDFAKIHGGDDELHFDSIALELEDLCVLAAAKTPKQQDNGLLQYRLRGGRQHYGYRFLVSTAPRREGDQPQLVRVLPEFSGGKKRG